MDELSYTRPGDSPLRLWFMRTVENLSGRKQCMPLYRQWQEQVANSSPRMWSEALKLLQIRLAIKAPADWQKSIATGLSTIVIANHPFGIADGLALLALLEQTGRPYRLILHSDIMRVPEVRKVGLPIDFSGTQEALRVNLETRAEVRRLLKEGVVIAVFPAGAVATAEDPFGPAEELPWKKFVARLVRQYQALVLPVYFEGQNSPLFHWVSRYSQTLRLSLLIHEFRRRFDSTINVTIGNTVEYDRIASSANDDSLTVELYVLVHRLAPGAERKDRSALLPRDPQLRRQFPCDQPLIVER
jgi:putative hemolysin